MWRVAKCHWSLRMMREAMSKERNEGKIGNQVDIPTGELGKDYRRYIYENK
jgi:hypothetical protein